MFVPLITLSLVALSAATKCSLRKHNAVDHTAQVPFATSLPPPKSSQVTVATSTASNPPSPTAFDYSRTKVRGVNLYVYRYPDWLNFSNQTLRRGGWLVLEVCTSMLFGSSTKTRGSHGSRLASSTALATTTLSMNLPLVNLWSLTLHRNCLIHTGTLCVYVMLKIMVLNMLIDISISGSLRTTLPPSKPPVSIMFGMCHFSTQAEFSILRFNN